MSEKYTVEDKGILVGPMKRFIWGPLLNVLPRSVSANAMTLGGTCLNVMGLSLAILLYPSRVGMGLASILVFIYLCLDNMDGAQARRTGTGSPLGEFLDHWLDSINGTYLSVAAVVCWENPNVAGIAAIALTTFAFSMTYWEQRVTGHAHFAILGNVEGIFLVSLLFGLQAVLGPHAVAGYKVIFGYSPTDLIVWLTIVTSALTAVGAALRVKRNFAEPLGMALAPAAIVLWHVRSAPPFVPLAILLSLTTPVSGGRMIASRVTKRPELGPDYWLLGPIVVAALGCAIFQPPPATQESVLLALLGYAILKVAVEFMMHVRRLAQHIRPGEFLSFAVRTPRA